MNRLVEVTPSTPRSGVVGQTRVMIFSPCHEIKGKKVGVGAIIKPDGGHEYGVVVGERMLKKHRSSTPLHPDDVSIVGEVGQVTVHVRGVRVKTMKIA